MRTRQSPLPLLWLLSDERNEAVLEEALARLPRGSGFVYRHYHLGERERQARFYSLSAVARSCGHTVVLSGPGALAREWGADGIYGASGNPGSEADLLQLATAHDAAEVQAACEAGAHGIFLSPVFATRSHPGGATLGAMGFHVLAQQSPVPVIALGGMTADRARMLGWPRWGAIDGLA